MNRSKNLLIFHLIFFSISVFADDYALIIGGTGGDKSFYDRFWSATSQLRQTLIDQYNYEPQKITLLFEDDSDPIVNAKSTKIEIENYFAKIDQKIDDRFTLFVVGHANRSGNGLKINLPGRDLTTDLLAQNLQKIPAQKQILIFSFPYSGLIIPILENPNRLIITSCTAREGHARSNFENIFVDAIAIPKPLDEIFTSVDSEVRLWYENDGSIRSEHPQISGDQFMLSDRVETKILTSVNKSKSEIDLDQLIANAPTAEDLPDTDALILSETEEIDIDENSDYRHTTRQIIKIFNEDGHRFGVVLSPYTRGSDQIEIHHARTIHPNGEIFELDRSTIVKDLFPSGTIEVGMYVEARLQKFVLPKMIDNCVIDFEYTTKNHGHLLKGEFWRQIYFQTSNPIDRYQLTIRLPKKRSLRYNFFGSELQTEITESRYTRTYRFFGENIPPLKNEPLMPSAEDLAASISISTLESWEKLMMWYSTLIREQDQITPAIEAKTNELIATAFTQREKIKRLYEFVAQQIDYVAIELGIWAIKPHLADLVLSEGYGDCKDKSTLLSTMLKVAGISSYPVLISAGNSRRIDQEIPSLAYFNHMIVAVKINDSNNFLWLDPTAETCVLGDLPVSDQQRWAIALDPDDLTNVYQFVKTPSINTNEKRVKTKITVSDDLSVTVDQSIVLKGDFGMKARSRFKHPDRENYIRKLLQLDEKADLVKFRVQNESEVFDPLRISATWSYPNYVYALGRQFVLELPIETPFTDLLEQRDRTHPIHFEKMIDLIDEIEITLPDRFELESVGKKQSVINEIGSFVFLSSHSRRKAKLKRTFSIDEPIVSADQFSEVQSLIRAMSAVNKIFMIE